MRPRRPIASALASAALLSQAALAQTTSVPQTPPAPRAPTTTGRPSVPMPVQKQSLGYFAGRWTFHWTGPQTPLGPGPRSGTVTFTPRDGGRALDGVTEATSDDGPYRETATVRFNDDSKTLAWAERRPNGVEIAATGDWSSPIAIRFAIAPFKIKGQTYQLKRTLRVISANSFSITEEWSVDGGPFKRLGNGVFTKQFGQ